VRQVGTALAVCLVASTLAAWAGCNDLHFVPLLLTVACASLTLAIDSPFARGGDFLLLATNSDRNKRVGQI
jgi:hypothetical protein